MEQLTVLMNEYNAILNSINKTNNYEEKQELENKLKILNYNIEEAISEELKKGPPTKEFIELCARFDCNNVINSNVQDKNIDVSQNERIGLDSEFIISKYTGEKIDLTKLSNADKIKQIYDHTDYIIDINDPVFVERCNNRMNLFGENASTYKTVYEQTLRRVIGNLVNEVNIENKEKFDKLSKRESELSEREHTLSEEVKTLRDEVSVLSEEFGVANKIESGLNKLTQQVKGETQNLNNSSSSQIVIDKLNALKDAITSSGVYLDSSPEVPVHTTEEPARKR